jgi:hypothetical protein
MSTRASSQPATARPAVGDVGGRGRGTRCDRLPPSGTVRRHEAEGTCVPGISSRPLAACCARRQHARHRHVPARGSSKPLLTLPPPRGQHVRYRPKCEGLCAHSCALTVPVQAPPQHQTVQEAGSRPRTVLRDGAAAWCLPCVTSYPTGWSSGGSRRLSPRALPARARGQPRGRVGPSSGVAAETERLTGDMRRRWPPNVTREPFAHAGLSEDRARNREIERALSAPSSGPESMRCATGSCGWIRSTHLLLRLVVTHRARACDDVAVR